MDLFGSLLNQVMPADIKRLKVWSCEPNLPVPKEVVTEGKSMGSFTASTSINNSDFKYTLQCLPGPFQKPRPRHWWCEHVQWPLPQFCQRMHWRLAGDQKHSQLPPHPSTGTPSYKETCSKASVLRKAARLKLASHYLYLTARPGVRNESSLMSKLTGTQNYISKIHFVHIFHSITFCILFSGAFYILFWRSVPINNTLLCNEKNGWTSG